MKQIFESLKLTQPRVVAAAMILCALLSGAGLARGQTCTSSPSGLAAWWNGDHNSQDMVGTNNGTLMNGAAYGIGKVAGAFSFTGASDSYVDIPDSESLNPAAGFSVDGWFYIEPWGSSAGRLNTLVSKGDGYPPNGGWDLAFDDRYRLRTLYFLVNGSDGNYLELTQNNAINDPGWYHVAATFDPSAAPQAKLFLNGTVVADSGGGSIPSVKTNTMTMRIGAMHWTEDFGAGSDRMVGMADEVHFFNRALPPAGIAALYNAGGAGVCPVTEPSFALRQGWNFISLPKLPSSHDIPTVLADVLSKVAIIWGWNGDEQLWQKWTPSGGGSNTLLSLDLGKGYWIYLQSPGAIDVSQWATVQSFLPSVFTPGWNLIGYNGTNGLVVSDGLQFISGQWSMTWNWTAGAWNAQAPAIPGLPAHIGPLTHLYLGKAYWVKVKDTYVPQFALWDASTWDNSIWGP